MAGGWANHIQDNLTGVKRDSTISKWHPATPSKVRLKIYRFNVTRRFVPNGEAAMTDGMFDLSFQPSHLFALIKE